MAAWRITNATRSREQYEAELHRNGQLVGKVRRGLNRGSSRDSEYKAVLFGGSPAYDASGRTLSDLRAELEDFDEDLAEMLGWDD